MVYSPTANINNSGTKIMEFWRTRLNASNMYDVMVQDKNDPGRVSGGERLARSAKKCGAAASAVG